MISSIFNKKINRCIYFIRHGEYKGEFIVEVDEEGDNKVFLGLPDKDIHIVSSKDVEDGIKNKVILPVEKLPKSVYNVCVKEYKLIKSEKHINYNNRRKPSLLPCV